VAIASEALKFLNFIRQIPVLSSSAAAYPLISFTAVRTCCCSEQKIFTRPDDCGTLYKFVIVIGVIRTFSTKIEKYQLCGNNSACAGAFQLLRGRAPAQLRGNTLLLLLLLLLLLIDCAFLDRHVKELFDNYLLPPPIPVAARTKAERLLGSWVRIPLGAWMFVSCECLCCQVEVSVTGRSLVRRSPTDCGVCLSVIK
jgi:hypothetical protein